MDETVKYACGFLVAGLATVTALVGVLTFALLRLASQLVLLARNTSIKEIAKDARDERAGLLAIRELAGNAAWKKPQPASPPLTSPKVFKGLTQTFGF